MGIVCCCCGCCLKDISSKTLEILLIIFHSISVIFLISCLIIISWSKISYINLIIFVLMLIINVLCLTFITLINIWRKKKIIQTTKKKIGIIFSTIGFIILIICLVITVIEEFLISYGFSNADYPCKNKKIEKNDMNYNNQFIFKKAFYNINTIDNKIIRKLKDFDCTEHGKYYYAQEINTEEYFFSYFTFSYLQISLFLGIIIWRILKKRIDLGLDKPVSIAKTQKIRFNLYIKPIDSYHRLKVVIPDCDNSIQFIITLSLEDNS